MAKVLSTLHSQGSLLIELHAMNNSLTKMPDLSNFNLIQLVSLGSNKITSVPTGSFNCSSKSSCSINLSGNQILAISPGAFDFPNAGSFSIQLGVNKITSIPLGLIKSYAAQASITITLESNNITSISSGTFNYPPASSITLDLKSNAISTIQPGSFEGTTLILVCMNASFPSYSES